MLEAFLFAELMYVVAILVQAGIAALCGVRVERISFGFGPKLLRLWRFQITWLPIGGYVRLAGLHPTEQPVGNDDRRAFFARPLPLRLLTILGWPIGAQLFLAAVITAVLLKFGAGVPANHLVVLGVTPGSPAASGGIHVGDELLTVDGQPITPTLLRQRVEASEGRPLTVGLRRAGAPLQLEVTPARGETGELRIGIRDVQGETRVAVAPEQAVLEGLSTPLRSQQRIVEAIVTLAEQGTQPSFVAPVGAADTIAREADDVARIRMLAHLGAYVVLFSLLPIPPLPGAQLLGVLFGWRSRRGRNDFAAKDVGEVIWTERSIPRFLIFALLPLAAVAALVSYVTFMLPEMKGSPEALVLVGGIALLTVSLASGWPRAWSWGLYLPVQLAPSILLTFVAEAWLAAAILLVTPLALCTPGVRRYFRQECPVCHQLTGRPVRSSRAHCCLACGSVWRPE